MQNKTLNYVLLSIPLEAMEDAGIAPGSLLEITAEKNKVSIRAVEDMSDFVCDGDCENGAVGRAERMGGKFCGELHLCPRHRARDRGRVRR